ncbi:MAG: hypothetical protein ACREH5_03870, partial [Candidatus Omnitrophota bacterium]
MSAPLTQEGSGLVSRGLRVILAAMALWYLVAYVGMAYFRIRYPFDLELLEGYTVDVIARVLSGQKIYVSPSLEFISPIYSPLYYYFSGLLAKMVGLGFLAPRLVSFLSAAGSFFLIYLIVKKETKSFFAGFLSSGLMAATFDLGNGWYDLARVDSLFLFFLLVAIYLLRFHATASGWFTAA